MLGDGRPVAYLQCVGEIKHGREANCEVVRKGVASRLLVQHLQKLWQLLITLQTETRHTTTY